MSSPPPPPPRYTHTPPSSVDGKTTLAPPEGCGRGSGGGRQRPAVNKGGKKMRGARRGEGRLRAAAEHRARTLFRLRRSASAPGFSGSRSARPGSVCLGRRRAEGRGSPGTATRPGTRQKVAHSWGRKVSGSGGFGAGPDGGLRPGLPSPFLGLGLEL